MRAYMPAYLPLLTGSVILSIRAANEYAWDLRRLSSRAEVG